MTIIQLGRTRPLTDRTTPVNPFVREINIGPYTTDAGLLAEFPGLDESGRPTLSVIGVRDQLGATYQEFQTVAEVYLNPLSFHFDSGEQVLTLHIARTDAPMNNIYFYGIAQGFTDSHLIYVDNIQFLPLLKSVPAIRQQQDIENYNRLSFVTGRIDISNADGRLDTLIPAPVYGNDVIVYDLPMKDNREHYTSDELNQLATLFVEDFDLSPERLDLRIQDRRKAQNISIPMHRFLTADYPQIEDELTGEVIPVLWGQPIEIPAVITNGKATTGNVKYRAAILLTNIGTVQVDNNGTWETKTATNVNLATGEFELSAANARDENGSPLDCKLVQPVGILITYISDIIKDANERFGGVTYTVSNYDIDEWEAEEVSLSTGAYYLAESKKLFEVIPELQNGANVGFRYEIKPDGRRTIRIDNETREPVCYIPNILLRNRLTMKVSTDSSTLAAEVVVKWGISYESGRSRRYVDNSERQAVIDTYQQAPRREYPDGDPVIVSQAAAIERAGYVLDRFSRIRGIVDLEIMAGGEAVTDDRRRQLMSLRIYDIIDVEITPAEFIDRDNAGIIGRQFYGIWRCKIIEIAPDSGRGINTVRAVLVEDLNG